MPDGQNGVLENVTDAAAGVDAIYRPVVAPLPAVPQLERPAYVTEDYKWGNGTRGTSGGTITWAVVSSTGQSYSADSNYTSAATPISSVFMPTIRQAFARWDEVGNFSFVETSSPATADMVLIFDELQTQSASTIGLAYTWYSGSVIRNSYISFDIGRRYRLIDGTVQTVGSSPTGGTSDFYTLALHEVGHALGLDHENDFATVMNASQNSSVTDLTADEIDAIRFIYGTPSNAGSDDWANTTSTTGNVVVGSTATGNIETTGDSDWFRVSLTAGVAYRFEVRVGTLADPFLNLRNSNGTTIASDDNSGGNNAALLTYTPTSSGTYYLDARGATATSIGTYVVAVTQVNATTDDYAGSTATTGAIAVGGTVTGNIEIGDDRDWFRVTLTAGVTYRIDLTGGTLADPLLYVRNSSGTALVSDDDSGPGLNATLTYTPTTTGTYYFDAQGATLTGTGTYTLSLNQIGGDDYPASTATPGTLTVGSTLTGSIGQAADVDWIRVSLLSGVLYRFDARGSATSGGTLGDPSLQLLNSNGTTLVTDNDSGVGADSRIMFRAVTSGTYYLAVRSNAASATGTYTVSATANGDDYTATSATTGSVSPGGTAEGIIEVAGDRDWFRATLTAGTTYNIRVAGTATGSALRWTESSAVLRTSNGTQVAANTATGLGASALLTYTAISSGTFYIDTQAYSSGVGSYIVSVTTGQASEAPAVLEDAALSEDQLAALTAPPVITLDDLPLQTVRFGTVPADDPLAAILTPPPAALFALSVEEQNRINQLFQPHLSNQYNQLPF